MSELNKLREQRSELDSRIDTLLAKPSAEWTTADNDEVRTLEDDMGSLQLSISQAHLKELRRAPMISPAGIQGRPQPEVSKLCDWLRGDHRTEPRFNLELRATTAANLGGATTVASSEFTRMMARDSVLFGLATVTTVSSGAPMSFYRQTSQSTMAVTAEGVELTNTDNTASVVTITPKKSSGRTLISREALSDLVYDAEAEILSQHAEGHARFWEGEFLTGHANLTDGLTANGTQSLIDCDGASDVTATGFALSHADSDSPGTAISFANSITIMHDSALLNGYKNNAVWFMSPSCWAATISQTASAWPLFSGYSDKNTASTGTAYQLGGYPVYTSTSFPTNANHQVRAVFGDIRKAYRIVMVNSLEMMANPYSASVTGQVAFESTMRTSAKIIDRQACVLSFA